MEIIVASLVGLSGVILNLVWVPTVRCIRYTGTIGENLEELQEAISRLRDMKADIVRKLAGSEASRQVDGWLERVEAFESKANQIVEARNYQAPKIKCYPTSCILSKKAAKMREKAKELLQQGSTLEIPPVSIAGLPTATATSH